MSDDTVSTAGASASSAAPVISANSNEIMLGSLADAFEVLQSFANEPLDGVTAAKIVRLMRWARPHFVRYVTARHVEAEKFGEKVAEGKIKIAAGANSIAFAKAIGPIRAEIVTIDPQMKIDVKTMSSVKISPLVIEILEPLLTGL